MIIWICPKCRCEFPKRGSGFCPFCKGEIELKSYEVNDEERKELYTGSQWKGVKKVVWKS